MSSFYARREEGREEVEAFGRKKFKAIGWHVHMDITGAVDDGRVEMERMSGSQVPMTWGPGMWETFYPHPWSTAGIQ